MANNSRLYVNGSDSNTSGVEYDAPDAFLNLAIEYDDGSTEALNYFQKKDGDFKSIGIKLYKDVPLHAMLMEILDADPDKADAIVGKLRATYARAKSATSETRERKLSL